MPTEFDILNFLLSRHIFYGNTITETVIYSWIYEVCSMFSCCKIECSILIFFHSNVYIFFILFIFAFLSYTFMLICKNYLITSYSIYLPVFGDLNYGVTFCQTEIFQCVQTALLFFYYNYWKKAIFIYTCKIEVFWHLSE